MNQLWVKRTRVRSVGPVHGLVRPCGTQTWVNCRPRCRPGPCGCASDAAARGDRLRCTLATSTIRSYRPVREGTPQEMRLLPAARAHLLTFSAELDGACANRSELACICSFPWHLAWVLLLHILLTALVLMVRRRLIVGPCASTSPGHLIKARAWLRAAGSARSCLSCWLLRSRQLAFCALCCLRRSAPSRSWWSRSSSNCWRCP